MAETAVIVDEGSYVSDFPHRYFVGPIPFSLYHLTVDPDGQITTWFTDEKGVRHREKGPRVVDLTTVKWEIDAGFLRKIANG